LSGLDIAITLDDSMFSWYKV